MLSKLSRGGCAVLLIGCGARTSLPISFDTGSLGNTGGSGAGGADATDPCPASVPHGAPKPMRGLCSTRDGRARIAVPKSPHLTWTATIPITDGSGSFGSTSLATDASGNAYVGSFGNLGGDPSFRRVDTVKGTIDWSVPLSPDISEFPTALLSSKGEVEVFANQPSAIISFDPSSGASTYHPLPKDYETVTPDAAIGTDGSLYFVREIGQGTASPSTVVSRATSDGTVMWSSANIATFGPGPLYGEVDPARIALGLDDQVLVQTLVLSAPDNSYIILTALDSATGVPQWTRAFMGDTLVAPMVGRDGSIVTTRGPLDSEELVVLEPSGEDRMHVDLPGIEATLAIATDGTMLVSTSTANDDHQLIAMSKSGNTLWHQTLDVREATVGSNGTVLVRDGFDLRGVDLSTGKTQWVLAPPHPSKCVSEATLTSTGDLIGLQCDGTLFGASD